MTITARMRPCQTRSRPRIELIVTLQPPSSASSGIDAVTLASPRRDQRMSEFLAKAENMHIQEVGKSRVAFIEQVLVKGGAGYHFAAMQSKVFQTGIFACRERDGFDALLHGPRTRIGRNMFDVD